MKKQPKKVKLKIGDEINDGDEYFDRARWRKTVHRIGSYVSADDPPYRRRKAQNIIKEPYNIIITHFEDIIKKLSNEERLELIHEVTAHLSRIQDCLEEEIEDK